MAEICWDGGFYRWNKQSGPNDNTPEIMEKENSFHEKQKTVLKQLQVVLNVRNAYISVNNTLDNYLPFVWDRRSIFNSMPDTFKDVSYIKTYYIWKLITYDQLSRMKILQNNKKPTYFHIYIFSFKDRLRMKTFYMEKFFLHSATKIAWKTLSIL